MRQERLRGLEGDSQIPAQALECYEEAWRSWRNLGSHIGGAAQTAPGPDAAVLVAVETWHRLASRVLRAGGGTWGSLLDRRCHFGDYVYNFRQFLILCRRQGRRRRDVAWSGIQLARYAPLAALRVAALAHYARATAERMGDSSLPLVPLDTFLDGLTSVCGHTDGSITQRAVEMCRAIR